MELNVGGNKLTHLPYEILRLVGPQGNLRRLLVHPNPLEEHVEVEQLTNEVISRGSSMLDAGLRMVINIPLSSMASAKWRPTFFKKGPFVFYNADGTILRRLSNPRLHDLPPYIQDTSRVPSLLELAVAVCARSSELNEIADLMSNISTRPLNAALNTAVLSVQAGGRSCSICTRQHVITRVEWTEWWSCLPPQTVGDLNDSKKQGLPLRRRGCSWKCLPPDVVEDA